MVELQRDADGCFWAAWEGFHPHPFNKLRTGSSPLPQKGMNFCIFLMIDAGIRERSQEGTRRPHPNKRWLNPVGVEQWR